MELESKGMEEYLEQLQKEVDVLQDRAKRAVDNMNQLVHIVNEEAVTRQEQITQQQAREQLAYQEQLARQQQLGWQQGMARPEQIDAAPRLEPLDQLGQQEQLSKQQQRDRRQEAARTYQPATSQFLEDPAYTSQFAFFLVSSKEQHLPPTSTATSHNMLVSPTGPTNSGAMGRHNDTPWPPPEQLTPRHSRADVLYLNAVSPESCQNLNMKRSRLEREREEIKERLDEHQARGSTKFKATMLEGAITEVEKLLAKNLQEFILHLRAVAVSISSRLAQEQARLHDRTYNWLRKARRRNWAAVTEPKLQVRQQSLPLAGAAHLERARLPRFDGKLENYADFKRRFQELVKSVQCSPVLEMTYLVDHLTLEASWYVRGVTKLAHAPQTHSGGTCRRVEGGRKTSV